MIIADIRLPDMNGYELMLKLQEVVDPVPLVLMTGFGYDPGHSIVKARKAGLRLRRALQAVPPRSTPHRRRAHHRRAGPGAAGFRELRTCRLMDAALLLLALLGHAALWVGLVNRLHARSLPHWLQNLATIACFLALLLVPLGLGWWCVCADPTVWNRLRAGQFLRSAPWGVLVYLVLCDCRGVLVLVGWLWLHVLHRPPAVSRFHGIRSLLHRDARPPEVAEHPHHFLVRLPGNQSLHLDLTERTIEVPRLPAAWDGLSLVHLSDLHFNGRVGKPYFQEIVRLSNELEPDIVALTGDLIDRTRCIDWIGDTLSRLTARYGVFCVLGNHDVRRDPAAVVRAIENCGLCYLGGRHLRIEVRGLPLILAGNEMPWLPAADLEHCPPPRRGGPFRIALSHSPDQLEWARDHDFDLVLAGHTHGGQIRLPLVGPIFSPSRRGLRYMAGVFHAPPTIMHVTRGVSGSFPFRWNCARKSPGWCCTHQGPGTRGRGPGSRKAPRLRRGLKMMAPARV